MRLFKRLYFVSPWILQNLIWIPTRLLLIVFGRVEIRGKANLRGLSGNAIFACNHSSEMDVFMVPGTLPMMSRFSPIFYTSREQSFYTRAKWRQRFYGGLFFNIWGAFPVQVGLHDYHMSLAAHEEMLQAGGSLCIFPEGRTTPDGNIQQGKGGVAYLAHATGRPIIPVRISGTFRLTPADLFLRRRILSVAYGTPIYVQARAGETLSPDDFKTIANSVMDAIRALPAAKQVVIPKPVTIPSAA